MSRAYSFDYNTTYDPPAPFMPITVDGHDPTKVPVTVEAFIDSGADGTMLPIDVLRAVGATYEASMWLRGTTGSRQRVDSYTVSIHIETETVHAISAVAMPAGSEPLIGRDVLNQLVVTLHGIASVTEVQIHSYHTATITPTEVKYRGLSNLAGHCVMKVDQRNGIFSRLLRIGQVMTMQVFLSKFQYGILIGKVIIASLIRNARSTCCMISVDNVPR